MIAKHAEKLKELRDNGDKDLSQSVKAMKSKNIDAVKRSPTKAVKEDQKKLTIPPL